MIISRPPTMASKQGYLTRNALESYQSFPPGGRNLLLFKLELTTNHFSPDEVVVFFPSRNTTERELHPCKLYLKKWSSNSADDQGYLKDHVYSTFALFKLRLASFGSDKFAVKLLCCDQAQQRRARTREQFTKPQTFTDGLFLEGVGFVQVK